MGMFLEMNRKDSWRFPVSECPTDDLSEMLTTNTSVMCITCDCKKSLVIIVGKKCRTFLFIAKTLLITSLATRTQKTFANTVSFTKRYSRDDLCQLM